MVHLVLWAIGAVVAGMVAITLFFSWLKVKSLPKPPKTFRSVKVGSSFDLTDVDGTTAIVCQKVSHNRYLILTGKEKGDRVKADPSMPVYNIDEY